MANIRGTKWGSSIMGTPGGTVTWSIAGPGWDISRFGVSTGVSVSGSSFLYFDFVQVIADAFAEWSRHGNIEFQQMPDLGGAAGLGAHADIRIFFGTIPGSSAGYAFYPSAYGSAIGGDILLDTMTSFNSNRPLFKNLVLHEIGHALGLEHTGELSIMRPTISPIGLQADDILGIKLIYGPQDGLAQTSGGGGMTGNELNNLIVGSRGADAMDGAEGDDILRGNHGNDTITGGDGRDTLVGGTGNDELSGDASNDLLAGKRGHDALNGGEGADKLFGGQGRDTMMGGEQNDSLHGGIGSDLLTGGGGDDTLKGGGWADVFIFEDNHGNDTIVDFQDALTSEKIDLSNVSTIAGIGDVLENATEENGSVLIDTGTDSSILLRGVSLGDLDADDFVF